MADYASLVLYDDTPVEGGKYRLLKFPETSSDVLHMGGADRYTIIPSREGVGLLELNIVWEEGDYSELRDVFVRDPFKVTKDPDNRTAYDHRPPSPGVQCFTKQHTLLVHPNVALGVYVYHDDVVPRSVTMAQLKLTIL